MRLGEKNIELTIADNGKGIANISTDAHVSGFGLSGIEQRCRMLSGSFNVAAGVNNGTTLTVQIPIEGQLKIHQERI
jgi:signal transduction histidine kinase